jgi:hypothetical protein
MAAVMAVVGYAQEKELVTLPTGVEAETWYVGQGHYYAYSGEDWVDATSYISSIQVAFSGNDIYIQGLAYYMSNAWVKGTINGTTVTIPTGQYIGSDSNGDEYINGQDVNASSSSDPAIDIVFTYDAENGTLTLDPNIGILESGEKNSLKATYAYWENLVLTKTEPEAPAVVELPDGLVPVEYLLTATDDYDNSEVKRPAYVVINGTDAYIKGLTAIIPTAWVKGTVDGNKITVPANTYLGVFYDAYGIGYLYFNPSADVEFTINENEKTISAATYSNMCDGYTMEGYKDIVLTFINEKAGTPANPSISEIELYEENIYRAVFEVPTMDTEGNAMLTSKLTFKFFKEVGSEVSAYTFTPALYKNLEADMTDVPFGFTDDYDFYQGVIYFNEDVSAWNRIGIQATYTGGGETHTTDIQWVNVADVMGINSVQTDRNNGRNAIYNLNGQRVNNATKGLYIINGKKVVIK